MADDTQGWSPVAEPTGWSPVAEPATPPGPDLDAQLHQAYDSRPLWRKALGLEPENLSPELQQHLAEQKQNAGKQIASQLTGVYSGYGEGAKAVAKAAPFFALGPAGGAVSSAVGGGGLGLAANAVTQGLGGAAISKLEGASNTGAAVTGALSAAGPVISKVAEAAGPRLAETALNIRRMDRAYGKTPGQAAIAETTGIAPDTVAASADQQIQTLNDQLTTAARAAPGLGSTQPAVDVVNDAMKTAVKRNNYAAMGPLQQLKQQLTEHVVTGQPLPRLRNAEDILEAKRGIGALINSWNPEIKSAYTGVKKQIYNALDNELDSLVPESQSLNQRISSLIPVRDRARGLALAPDIMQRSLQRFGAHTGALIGGLAGAREGYTAGGIPGAIAGGTAGVVLPEVLASPGFRMFMARAMGNPALREMYKSGGIGALVQAFQSNQQQSGQ